MLTVAFSDVWLSATHICTMANLPPPHLTDKITKLRFIQFTSAGVNHITQHPIYTQTKIPLATVSGGEQVLAYYKKDSQLITLPGIHGPPISEWIVMHILMEGHRVRMMEAWQREGRWGNLLGTQGAELRDSVGKRCGILGYGSIGRQSKSSRRQGKGRGRDKG